MGTTTIKVGAVIGLSGEIASTKNKVTNIKNSYNSTRNYIDIKILNRKNLYNRLQTVYSQIGSVEKKIANIKATVEYGATAYRRTDLQVLASFNEINNSLSAGQGTGTSSGAAAAFEAYGRKDSKEKEKGSWEVEGAVLSGTASASGKILGVNSSGSAEGNLIGGSVSTSAGAKFDLEDKNISIGASAEAEGHLAQGSLKGNIGILGGEVGGTVGAVSATGTIGATVYSDGKLSPSLEAKLEAKAAVVEGNAEVTLGTEEFNAHGKAEGSVLAAKAEASANLGVITYETSNGKTKTEVGAAAKVGAEAYLAEGEISGGFTLFGVDIDVGVSGKAGGVGVAAEARATTGGVSGEIGAGLGLGLGLEISIDWSDFSLW